MPEEQLEPTIANPFAPKSRQHQGTPIKNRNFLSSHVVEEKQLPKEYNPGFFVSAATKGKIRTELETGTLLEEDIPKVYEISSIISKILDREVPSLSDIEVGLAFKNRDNLKKIVEGEVEVDIVRRNHTAEVLARNERIKFWKEVAKITLENMPEKV